MKFTLKANAPEFTATTGPMAGRRFVHGVAYDQVPDTDRDRFEAVRQPRKKPVETETTDEITQSES